MAARLLLLLLPLLARADVLFRSRASWSSCRGGRAHRDLQPGLYFGASDAACSSRFLLRVGDGQVVRELVATSGAPFLHVRANETYVVRDHTHLVLAGIRNDGALRIGSPEAPAQNVTIAIDGPREFCVAGAHHDDFSLFSEAERACLQRGQVVSTGELTIHGLPKTPFANLTQEVPAGSSQIAVDACAGWRVGDELAVSPTGNERAGFAPYDLAPQGTHRVWRATIRSLSGCQLVVDPPAPARYRSEFVHGYWLRARVLNLARSVRFDSLTLPKRCAAAEDRGCGVQGFTLVQSHTGVARISFASFRNCGREYLGSYCLHLHRMGETPSVLRGNVVVDGFNKGSPLKPTALVRSTTLTPTQTPPGSHRNHRPRNPWRARG